MRTQRMAFGEGKQKCYPHREVDINELREKLENVIRNTEQIDKI